MVSPCDAQQQQQAPAVISQPISHPKPNGPWDPSPLPSTAAHRDMTAWLGGVGACRLGGRKKNVEGASLPNSAGGEGESRNEGPARVHVGVGQALSRLTLGARGVQGPELARVRQYIQVLGTHGTDGGLAAAPQPSHIPPSTHT